MGPIFDLFDPAVDLHTERVDGLAPEHVFGAHNRNPAEFTCELVDEWDVATFCGLCFTSRERHKRQTPRLRGAYRPHFLLRGTATVVL